MNTEKLEPERDTRPDHMADEIFTLNENGKPVEVKIADDPESVAKEGQADVKYD